MQIDSFLGVVWFSSYGGKAEGIQREEGMEWDGGEGGRAWRAGTAKTIACAGFSFNKKGTARID